MLLKKWYASKSKIQGSLRFYKMSIARSKSKSSRRLSKNRKHEEVITQEWFRDVSTREEAESLLLSDENSVGTYLVRPSTQDPSGYSLSVKAHEEGRGVHVKHYKIYYLKKSGQYRISSDKKYNSLPELIEYYTDGAVARNEVQWEIPHSNIKLGEEIASGNFGTVHRGVWKGHIKVAVKTLKEGTMTVEAFLAEAVIMKEMRHKRLLALLAVCTSEEPIYIVTEYLKNGSLLNLLRKEPKENYRKLLMFAEQIADGMKYLEEKKFVHRDLAARNVLVDDNYGMKICDFGLTRAIKEDVYKATQSGFPVRWTAPEACRYHTFTIKSDVWSYGILLMELFTYGAKPYPSIDKTDLLDNLLAGYRMSKPELLTEKSDSKIYPLMLKCWSARPEERPSFAEVYEFFNKHNSNSKNIWQKISSYCGDKNN